MISMLNSLCFAFWAPVAAFPFEILELPHPCQRRGFWVCRNFSSYHSLPEEQDPSGFLLTLLFLLLFPYHFIQRLLLFSHSVVSDSLQPHGLQHARLPCPSPFPWVSSNSRPLSQQYHPTISSSVVPFSSSLQSFPALGSFLMKRDYLKRFLFSRKDLDLYWT